MKSFPSLLLGAALFAAGSVSAQTALVEYRFNETGVTAPNTGSAGSADLRLFASNGSTPTDYHGAAGSGVSGLAGDIALDFTSATGMGNAGTGPVANQAADLAAVDGLRSLTLQGWFKTDSTTPIGNSARLFQNSLSGNGFALIATTSGNLQLSLGNGSSTNFASTTNSYSATQSWVFFAVTYDGTTTTNNVRFYVGDSVNAVSLAQTFSYAGGVLGNDGAALAIGNESSSFQRPFDGSMDNFRIFGATGTSSAGALGLTDLEAIRAADLTNTVVPEPGTVALLGLAGIALLWRRSRRRA